MGESKFVQNTHELIKPWLAGNHRKQHVGDTDPVKFLFTPSWEDYGLTPSLEQRLLRVKSWECASL